MKNNTVTDILSSWNFIPDREKLLRLQQFETEVANWQGRRSRVVTPDDSLDLQEGKANAMYDFQRPDRIFISPKFRNRAIDSLDTIFHESFHAYVDDFFENKTDLRTLTDIDRTRLFEERELMDIIYNRAVIENAIEAFAVGYYEEVIVRKETAMYLVSQIMNACENMGDCIGMFSDYQYCYGIIQNAQYYQSRLEAMGKSYSKIKQMAFEVDQNIFSDKKRPIDTDRQIFDNICEPLTAFFEENMKIYRAIQKISQLNPNMSDGGLSQQFAGNMVRQTGLPKFAVGTLY